MLSAKELGEKADLYWETKTKRLAADKVAAAFKAEESALQALLINEMREQEISAVGGKTVRLGMDSPDMTPVVKDWALYYDYIVANRAFELLERRPGRLACKERWEQGVEIPGVEKFPVYKLTKEGVK